MVELIGYIAGILTVGTFLPQVIKSWKTKRTRDLSWVTCVLLVTSALTWTVYGIGMKSTPMIATNFCMVICSGLILLRKVLSDFNN